MSALATVRDAIARAVLGEVAPDRVTLGAIELRPHQLGALGRIRSAIAEFGGALLADEPGLGKTFVALALARDYQRVFVAAPAALCSMWRDAAEAARVSVTFVSTESLSRRDACAGADAHLVIVDEAHHANNPATARYARLARLTTRAHVLLLTATPIRNRADEFHAVLALFLGARATALDEPALARIIVRRTSQVARMPRVIGPTWYRPPPTPDIGPALRALPPALPALDGTEAHALVAMTLARCWASSLAALDVALRRRLQRGAALHAALADGRLPSRAELRTWTIGEDAVQLAFPQVAIVRRPDESAPAQSDTEIPATPDPVAPRAMLAAHLAAVGALRAVVSPHVARDSRLRARLLRRLRAEHAHARIVAFTSHAATAEALYRAMRRDRGVALLTARGAQTAGGPRPRSDILEALAPGSHARAASGADDITLVIATDLLSEGVNLQGACVVVHLDVPWTPAALTQRVGRVARIGSTHQAVFVHGIAAPSRAEALLSFGRRHIRKQAASDQAMHGAGTTETLREACAAWRCDPPPAHVPAAAAAYGRTNGFVAVVTVAGKAFVVAGMRRGTSRVKVSDQPDDIAALVAAVSDAPAPLAADDLTGARRALRRWIERRVARSRTASHSGPPSTVRRRLLARLDALITRSSPNARAPLAARVDRIRRQLEVALSVGAENELTRFNARSAPDDAAWLDVLESLCDRIGTQRRLAGASGEPSAAATILLIVERRGARDRSRDRARALSAWPVPNSSTLPVGSSHP